MLDKSWHYQLLSIELCCLLNWRWWFAPWSSWWNGCFVCWICWCNGIWSACSEMHVWVCHYVGWCVFCTYLYWLSIELIGWRWWHCMCRRNGCGLLLLSILISSMVWFMRWSPLSWLGIQYFRTSVKKGDNKQLVTTMRDIQIYCYNYHNAEFAECSGWLEGYEFLIIQEVSLKHLSSLYSNNYHRHIKPTKCILQYQHHAIVLFLQH